MRQKSMTYTFIIPAKNEEKRLPTCLNAIHTAAAGKWPYEIIVVDNGSTDRTTEVAAVNGAKVLDLPHGTISALRNYGARISTGDILIFVDADCAVSITYLDTAAELLNDKDVGIVTGNIEIPTNSGWVPRAWSMNWFYKNEPYQVSWASSMNMIMRRPTFFAVGGFDEAMATCEDVEFCKRIKKKGFYILHHCRSSVVHYGEAATLLAFFKKERWRGKSLLKFALTKANTAREVALLFSFFFSLSVKLQ